MSIRDTEVWRGPSQTIHTDVSWFYPGKQAEALLNFNSWVQANLSPHTDFLLLFLNLEDRHFCCHETAAQQVIDDIISNCNHI